MAKIVECVPNFSEGKDLEKIKLITDEIEKVSNVKLLDVDPGAATNRTVVTMAGDPEAVVEAAFNAIKKASEVIDMRNQTGAHARMGATDVCPFIPISGMTYDDCIPLAKKLGERVGKELDIPVYLYGMAAQKPERERLPDIRKGEYEALPQKMKKPDFVPDYGRAEFNAKSGATAVGVRKFLIAYNVNLNTTRKKIASEIGFEVREVGRAIRDENGKKVRDENNKLVRRPGLLKNTQAAGWYIDEYKRAQVTVNLMDHKETPLHIVYETIKDQAEKLGARVTGSELIGLIPKEAMLDAGRYYLDKQKTARSFSEREIIRIAVLSMGLDELAPFDIEKKIIEYNFEKPGLKDMKFVDFVDELASDSPAPGGGSVAAMIGSMGAALATMVSNLTAYKKKFKKHKSKMFEIGEKAQLLQKDLVYAIDEDTEAFNKMAEAGRLPKKSDEEKK
ncbi:MAG: glutamate formimidoyltransferase, partial [Candidatus Muiribacteriota bacterium]